MPDDLVVSVILCTRNRASALCETLDALTGVEVPFAAELLVIDNASTDGTREVVSASRAARLHVRYTTEPEPGKARALNTGLAAARGRVLLFLDDDVRPPHGWLHDMSRPVLDGAADAVAGGVRIAPHLVRAWMEPIHRAWLAETSFLDRRAPQEMVGANMAIGRHVLDKVPAFDPELGPGALGQGDDSLFSWQLLRAGFRIAPALDVAVEHHFDHGRLLRASFREAAERRGRVLAYQKHHWEHVEVADLDRRWLRAWSRLGMKRLARRRERASHEGMPSWEMLALEELSFLRRWRTERHRPHNYERHGLRRRVEA